MPLGPKEKALLRTITLEDILEDTVPDGTTTHLVILRLAEEIASLKKTLNILKN